MPIEFQTVHSLIRILILSYRFTVMQWAQALDRGPWVQVFKVPGNCTPLCWQTTEGQIGPDKLAVVASFYYLADMLSAADGFEFSTTTHVETTWKKFNELLPALSSRHLSFKTCGRVYSSCVLSIMLHASETPTLTNPNSYVCIGIKEQNQTDLQWQAARHCHHQVQWATCAAWQWRP